jgi:hypothetical protein
MQINTHHMKSPRNQDATSSLLQLYLIKSYLLFCRLWKEDNDNEDFRLIVPTVLAKNHIVSFVEKGQYIFCPDLKWPINHGFHLALYVLPFGNEEVITGPFVQFALIRDIHLWKVGSSQTGLTWAVSAPGCPSPTLCLVSLCAEELNQLVGGTGTKGKDNKENCSRIEFMYNVW